MTNTVQVIMSAKDRYGWAFRLTRSNIHQDKISENALTQILGHPRLSTSGKPAHCVEVWIVGGGGPALYVIAWLQFHHNTRTLIRSRFMPVDLEISLGKLEVDPATPFWMHAELSSSPSPMAVNPRPAGMLIMPQFSLISVTKDRKLKPMQKQCSFASLL